jgi:hypothetical protein
MDEQAEESKKNTDSIPHIYVKGKEFVYDVPSADVSDTGSTTKRFVVRGVAVSASGSTGLGITDILADDYHDLMVDHIIPKLKDLNVNCIRVYEIHPKVSYPKYHKKSMDSLKEEGIYVMVGLASPTYSINRITGAYGYGVFYHAAQVVNEFANYDNTLCFSVGNEVEFPGEQATLLNIANPDSTANEIVADTINMEIKVAQAMKSFARDIKAHMKKKQFRPIPVGVAMQDGPQVNWNDTNKLSYQIGIIGTDIIAQYYAAGKPAGKPDDQMDFIGINTYAYVSGLKQHKSAYDRLATESKPLPIPVFLSETGAITNPPRTWKVVPEMYTNKKLYEQLSGQVAFQLLEEGAGFGLYSVSGTYPNITLTATTNGGASALATEFGLTEPSPLNKAVDTPVSPTTAPPSFGLNPTVTVTWPKDLLPPYKEKKRDTSITIENYAENEIQITQYDTVFDNVAAGSKTSPTSKTINVLSGAALSIQGKVKKQGIYEWYNVCGVAAKNIKKGITIKNNVTWGVYAGCNVDLGEGNEISINVENYGNVKIDVVVEDNVVTSVQKSSDGNTPVKKTVSLKYIGKLHLQTLSFDEICYVSPLRITDGVTISNKAPWYQHPGPDLACDIAIKPSLSPIYFENYSVHDEMDIYQGGSKIGYVDVANSANKPNKKMIPLPVLNDVFLKNSSGVICRVPAAALKEGMTIGNNLEKDKDGDSTICKIHY